jgi:hypothetical protein
MWVSLAASQAHITNSATQQELLQLGSLILRHYKTHLPASTLLT